MPCRRLRHLVRAEPLRAQQQPDGGGERRVPDVVGEPAESDRRAAPHGHVEDLLGDLRQPVEVRAPP